MIKCSDSASKHHLVSQRLTSRIKKKAKPYDELQKMLPIPTATQCKIILEKVDISKLSF